MVVIANALWASRYEAAVHYSRDEGYHTREFQAYPEGLTNSYVLGVLTPLVAEGYLDESRVNAGSANKMRSTFKATPKLEALFVEHGLTPSDVRVLESRPTVILKNAEKHRVRFDVNEPQAESALLAMKRINDAHAHLPIQFVDKHEVMHTLALGEFFTIYHLGTFDEGGRIYCNAYQMLPKEIRASIRILGQPTRELDYKGMFPRMLYHLEGIRYEDDPYTIPALVEIAEEQGHDLKVLRGKVKILFQAMLNSKSNRGRVGFNPDKPWEDPDPIDWPDGVTEAKAKRMIEECHSRIAHRFYTLACFDLMHKESRICTAIILDGIDQGIEILSVHDSYIVREEHVDWLKERMIARYEEKVGMLPIIDG